MKQQNVSNWLKKRQLLPAEHVIVVESATGISRHELRPDIYPIEQPQSLNTAVSGQLEIAK